MAHLGIDARLTQYRVGGISTYIRRLTEALEKLDTDHHFTIFHSRKVTSSLTQKFSSARLWTPPHHRYERLALSLELLRFNLDVLHSPDFIPPLRGARRHVITVHDLTFFHYPQHKDHEARRYYNDQIERAVQKADHILSVSEATKADLVNMLNVPPEKITVQPHGVDERFKPLPSETLADACARLNLPETYILFVGTLEPRKNIPTLLDAYGRLRGQLPDLPPLLLVGRMGWLFQETMARIQEMQAQGADVIIRDDIEDDALPLLYNLASALVLPSFYEGFGLPALEAMACGTPVIVSDRSSLPEVVGDAGVLFEPNDPLVLAAALERILRDTQQRQMLREAGLQRAMNFTWERSAQTALSVYQAVLNG